jgi:steroid 5-alpha reductase family enzyme
MYVFLRWISGVPYTEAQALRTRCEDYRDYQRTTAMLIPWFPRRTPR